MEDVLNTKLCAAFCGVGKTYVCEKTDIKAVEIEYWKYKEKDLKKITLKILKNILERWNISLFLLSQKESNFYMTKDLI